MKQAITLCLLFLIGCFIYKIQSHQVKSSSKITTATVEIMNSFVGDVSVNSELDQVVVEPEMETFPVRISDVNNCKDCNKEVITNISMKYIFDLLTPEDFKEIKKMLNQSYETLTKVELFDLMKIEKYQA